MNNLLNQLHQEESSVNENQNLKPNYKQLCFCDNFSNWDRTETKIEPNSAYPGKFAGVIDRLISISKPKRSLQNTPRTRSQSGFQCYPSLSHEMLQPLGDH